MADVGIIIALVTLSVILVFINGWCLYVIARSAPLRLPSTSAIASLLSCHFLQGMLVIPTYVVKRLKIDNASISGPACDVFRTSYMINNYVSCLTLLLISADRMFAIKRPLKYRTGVTNRKMVIAVLILWSYVIVLCMLPFIPRSGKGSSSCRYQPQKEWTIAMLSGNTLLPFILILLCYFVIFKTARTARQQRTTLSSYAPNLNATRSAASEMKIAKISAAVVLAYAFCWGPSFVFYFLSSTCPSCFSKSFKNSKSEEILTFLMKFLTFIDGIIAPVIYCLKHRGFRDQIKLIRRRLIWPTAENTHINNTLTAARLQTNFTVKRNTFTG